jgi:hypothetical protein
VFQFPRQGYLRARLDCAKHDAGRTSALREYFVAHDDAPFVLGCHSFMPEEDDDLFAAIAERFEILGPADRALPG